MSQRTYTLREVAAIVAGCDEPEIISRLSRQIRHWTAEDIVPTIGHKHGGTGVHRRYDANGVRRAAVTAELVRYGITITGLGPFGEYLDGIEATEDWASAVSGNADIYLSYAMGSDRCGVNISRTGSIEKSDFLAFLKARKPEEWGIGQLDVGAFASALVINLTKLFDRLEMD